SITVTGRVSDTASGTLTNLITATTTASETMMANNHDTWVTTVAIPGQTDLVIAKTGPATTFPGDLITYYITISNAGATTATGTFITDTLPAAVGFATQASPFTFTQLGGTLIWQAGEVPTGTQHSITVTGRVVGTAAFITLTNRVTATTATSETVTDNNTDSWETSVGAVGEPQVLVSAVLYDGYQSSDTDEAVQLINVGDGVASLTNWELCKDTISGLSCRALPAAIISPTARIWLARDTAAFSTSFGFLPDYEMDSWLSSGLSNSGDEVVLQDDLGHTVDTLVYKEGDADLVGWNGETIQPYGVGRAEGQILYRVPDEATGLPIADTDTAADWVQYTGNVTHGRRVLYPGWDLDSLFWPLTSTEQATVIVGITPDNGFDVLSQTIARAQRTISVEVYSLRHSDIITALVQKAREGVSVTVFLEGGQVGVGTSDLRWQQELWACQQIEAAGGQCWFMIHETSDDIFNRYDYVHAKFLIVDDEWLLIGSQNFTDSSMPSDEKSNGTSGSRGVVLATNGPAVVARATEVFARDLDPAHHNDVLRWNTAYASKYGLPDPSYTPVLTTPDYVTYTTRFPNPLTVSDSCGFELFTAPEASLRQSDALLGLLAQAGVSDTVYVEQMYEYVDWGDNPADDPNLRLEAYIAAARRGATVRILLNGGAFGQPFYQNTNTDTVAYVNQIASAEGLNLKAAIGDPTAYGIHNKMVLVWLHQDDDEGGYAHIGSINGSEASSKVNREMVLQVRSDDVYHYLARVFEVDWWLAHSVFLPLVLRNYTPPEPPVDYLVVSEVYYAGSVSTEWVEIYNPTWQTIDLSGYKIGDAEAVDRFEGMYQFPPGTVISAQSVLVVAFDGSQVTQADFEISNTSDTPDMIESTAWGTGDWTLRNDGDQVLLFGPTDQPVDVVVWGDAIYSGVTPHPGVGTFFTHSLERYPSYYDTDDCAFDFRDSYPPTPGDLPEW
ncbi:MAG: lamin tail domain-containing protein, partial [Chloroflexota bacterium]|nr:lamin tail domain-containing protein [Chloroflexota bacterium]